MWELEYTDEVKFYFIDNGDFVFDVLVKIEELKFEVDGLPATGYTQLEPDLYLWEVLQHWIIYRRSITTRTLRIAAIKPIA